MNAHKVFSATKGVRAFYAARVMCEMSLNETISPKLVISLTHKMFCGRK